MNNFYKNLDASTLLHWTVKDSRNSTKSYIAMSRIENYLLGVKNQVSRIEKGYSKAKRVGPDWQSAQAQLFIDIHFYFICWSNINKMIVTLNKFSGFKSIGKVYDKYKKTLKHYNEARDHLEHIYERLPGGRKKGALKKPGDLGNLFSKGIYSFGGDKWDISKKSFEMLNKIINELEVEIREEGIKYLENKGLDILKNT